MNLDQTNQFSSAPTLGFQSSSVVEQPAVNRPVEGSSPSSGAIPFPEESDWVQEEYDHWLDEIERIQELNLIQFQQELHKPNKQ
jgi:hypothetical protein